MTDFTLDPHISQQKAEDLNKADRIRELNDEFRKNLKNGGVVMSPFVTNLDTKLQQKLIEQVSTFDQFTPENDPYEEHDFGSFEYGNERYFWKIDYYDLNMLFMSPDPGDPAFTIRVLVLMHASEY